MSFVETTILYWIEQAARLLTNLYKAVIISILWVTFSRATVAFEMRLKSW
jgi:hypothetical protein